VLDVGEAIALDGHPAAGPVERLPMRRVAQAAGEGNATTEPPCGVGLRCESADLMESSDGSAGGPWWVLLYWLPEVLGCPESRRALREQG
jgi:hypothetical protein